uniref:Uncharacterized protein n=1 Tax=Anguilla anguilla TaxID=7936 RepID=A0A0E9RN60_ANGAN
MYQYWIYLFIFLSNIKIFFLRYSGVDDEMDPEIEEAFEKFCWNQKKDGNEAKRRKSEE